MKSFLDSFLRVWREFTIGQKMSIILAGLLATQANWVLAAYRRQGMRLERTLREGNWATLVLRP